MTIELRAARVRVRCVLVTFGLLVSSVGAQEGEGEDAFVPQIGIFVATHALNGATFVCRGEIVAGDSLQGQAFRASTDLGPFSLSSPSLGTISSYRGREVVERIDWKRVGGPFAVVWPSGLAIAGSTVEDDGSSFVAAAALHQVLLFPYRAFPEAESFAGSLGSAPGRFRDPQGLAANANALYVADRGNHRVQKFSLAGSNLAQVGSRGTAEGKFLRPNDVAVDSAGCVYVVDTGNHRVQKFDKDLQFVKSWGAFGPHPGFFAFPEGLECFEDTLYVVDTDNHRVQVFDLDGGLKYEWGLHALLPREGEGKLHYPADVAVARTPEGLVAVVTEPFEDRFQVFRETRPGEGLPPRVIPDRTIAAHFGPRLDIAEDLAVLFEPGAPSILMYDIEHEVAPWEPVQTCRLSSWGDRIGQFRCPTDVAIDSQRRVVYVADADTGRLASYRYAHTRATPLQYNPFEFQLVQSLDLAEHRRLATPELEFEIQPDALELHPSGELYVLDSLQNTVFVFTPRLELARTIELAVVEGQPTGRLIDLAFSPSGEVLYALDDRHPQLLLVELGGDPPQAPTRRPLDDATLRDNPRLLQPGGLAVAPGGAVFVSDTQACEIHRFDPDGRPRGSFGSPGLGRVQFHKPRGLDFDEQGRLYVLDWGNHRVQVLTREGEFIATFGSRLFTKPTLEAVK